MRRSFAAARRRARRPDAVARAGSRGARRWSTRCWRTPSRRRCSTASPARARPRSISRRSPRRCAPGRQVLVLLPEIALTRAVAEALRGPLRRAPAAWHSDLTSLERRETWRAIAEGRVGVVVGARSALFLPFADLGLIVVDEEHDGSFKQEDGVIYHARDMAVVRARLVGGAGRAGLGDAVAGERASTSTTGRYGALHLPDRHGGASLPTIAADRPARASRRRAAAGCRRRCVEAMKRDPGGGRADAAVPQPPRLRAAHAVPRLRPAASNARNARPGWSSTASAARWSAITAATPSRRRATCKYCGAVDSFVACGPGVERLAEEAHGAVSRGAARALHLRHADEPRRGDAPPSSA